jgi:putative ATP-dependent endonuclease of the OLD family
MPSLRNYRVRVQNFKCFDDWQGMERILPLNLIIGRNNSGKSTILDLMMQAFGRGPIQEKNRFGRLNSRPEVEVECLIDKEMIDKVVIHQQILPGGVRWDYDNLMKHVNGVYCKRKLSSGLDQHLVYCDGEHVNDGNIHAAAYGILKQSGYHYDQFHAFRLRADRYIRPEKSENVFELKDNGESATALIEKLLHEPGYRHVIVEEKLIEELNAVLSPDWVFTRIHTKWIDDRWELELEDRTKTVVPISQAGSGVKTLLLVLSFIHLVPVMRGLRLDQMIFCFEELENNLHSAVQRRLFHHLLSKAESEKCHLVITTHSHVVIDAFAQNNNVQLLHVVHDGVKAVVEPITSCLHACKAFEDLDVRASDLLQANAIIWVEGPSDRIYVNRWIYLWSQGKIMEGVHYQCIWYGGGLLSQVSFESVRVQAFMNALQVNRNFVVIMDRDTGGEAEPLKPHVDRIIKEATVIGGMAWVTGGREVENYIPLEIARRLASRRKSIPTIGRFDNFFIVTGINPKKKVALAHRVAACLDLDHITADAELARKVENVCALIKKWNDPT